MSKPHARKAFTGWHMTTILVAFFAVVITVNVVMARFALSTFGGAVVDNSYVASQHYNEWLQRAAAQERLGWEKAVTLGADRRVILAIAKDGRALADAAIVATLSHPLGRTPPAAIHFAPAPDGRFVSRERLPVGRWRIDLAVRSAADEARYRVDLQ